MNRDQCSVPFAAERLVHIHRVQQGFVLAGLELVGADEEAIRVFLNSVGEVVAWESVEPGFTELLTLVFRFTGEGHDGAILTLDIREVRAERDEVGETPALPGTFRSTRRVRWT